jgi:hypothetical protein
VQFETVFFLCVFKRQKHYFPSQIIGKNPDFVVGTGRNVVRRSISKFTLLSPGSPPKHQASMMSDILHPNIWCESSVLLYCFGKN